MKGDLKRMAEQNAKKDKKGKKNSGPSGTTYDQQQSDQNKQDGPIAVHLTDDIALRQNTDTEAAEGEGLAEAEGEGSSLLGGTAPGGSTDGGGGGIKKPKKLGKLKSKAQSTLFGESGEGAMSLDMMANSVWPAEK